MKALELDEHAINAAACANLTQTLNAIVDFRGYASAAVARLNRDAEPRRLVQWRIVDPYTGKWVNYGSGGQGPDLISLVAFLGSCSREDATACLAGITAAISA